VPARERSVPRRRIQELIHGLEENHPGTRHSILAGYEELAAIVASEYHSDRADDFEQELGVKGIGQTVRAGGPTTTATASART